MYKQTTKPMFLVPKRWRYLLLRNIYIFDRNFEDEAAKSSDSYLTPLMYNRERGDKKERTEKRLGRMRNEECCVCMVELKNNPVD